MTWKSALSVFAYEFAKRYIFYSLAMLIIYAFEYFIWGEIPSNDSIIFSFLVVNPIFALVTAASWMSGFMEGRLSFIREIAIEVTDDIVDQVRKEVLSELKKDKKTEQELRDLINGKEWKKQ